MSHEEDPIAAQASFFVGRMNQNHDDSIVAYARYFGKISDRSPDATARMTDINSKGFKLVYKANADAEEQEMWLPYLNDAVVTTYPQVRQMLIDMAEEAAAALKMHIKRDSDVKKPAEAASEKDTVQVEE